MSKRGKLCAYIIIGSPLESYERKNRFIDSATRFKRFLRTKVGVRDITLLDSRDHRDALDIGKTLSSLSLLGPNDTALVVYLGHGSAHGWTLDEFSVFFNHMIVEYFKSTRARVLIINECCYSASLFAELEHCNVPRHRIGVIAACRKHETVKQGLLEEVEARWRQGRAYRVPSKTNTKRLAFGTTIESLLALARSSLNLVMQRSDPPERERWGASLDHYFFPRKKVAA